MTQHARAYGWLPDLPDHRDRIHVPALAAAAQLPLFVDLRAGCPPVYDQGGLGSCTANMAAGAYEYDLKAQGLHDFMPSRNFIYYNERALHGWEAQDSGAYIRDACKVLSRQGACTEKAWPYVESRFARKPTAAAYKAALNHRALEYARVTQSHDQIRRTLASGRPVMFGFSVFESFESEQVAQDGMVPMPDPSESMLGGHAVLCVGYSDRMRGYIVRNSWGTRWGAEGHCYMPYDYVESPALADDFWTLRTVT